MECAGVPPPLLSIVYQCDGCLSSRGCEGSWLGCQVLPAVGAVSILELAANSGSSRMSQAPNLHLVMQFLTYVTTDPNNCSSFALLNYS